MANNLSILTASLALLAYTSADVTTVLNDITSLDQDVKKLTAAVDAYQGGLLGQLPLLADLTLVHVATNKGASDAKTLPTTLTFPDAKSIIVHVNGTLSVDNPKAIQVLESKKSLFQATGSGPAIKFGLQTLLNDHLDFSNAVLERTPQSLIADANAVVDVITNALQAGINAFSD